MTEKQKSRQEIEDEVAIIAALFSSIRRYGKDAFTELWELAYPYSGRTKHFSFLTDDALKKEYERILSEMSEKVMKAIRSAVSSAILKIESETDVSESASEAFTDSKYCSPEDRIDTYCSDFGSIAAAFIAAGLAEGMKSADLWNIYTTYEKNPTAAPLFRTTDAYLDIYTAAGGGKGRYVSPFANLDRLAKNTVHDAFSRAKVADMEHRGFRWYRCFRNSVWPCQACDDVCAVPHRITEIVLPVHPHCVCGMYPITDEEAI